jgi:hypothetical protein
VVKELRVSKTTDDAEGAQENALRSDISAHLRQFESTLQQSMRMNDVFLNLDDSRIQGDPFDFRKKERNIYYWMDGKDTPDATEGKSTRRSTYLSIYRGNGVQAKCRKITKSEITKLVNLLPARENLVPKDDLLDLALEHGRPDKEPFDFFYRELRWEPPKELKSP